MKGLTLFAVTLAWVIVRATDASQHETVPDLIRLNGYPCEVHYVTTSDGYILALHRIPYGKENHGRRIPREPVILQHGLLTSSASWVLNITHKSPAYLFADAGYDVWLTNIRGNLYTKNHTHLSIKSKKFWQFSWDEMAQYDLPCFIDYILNTTKHEQLYYVGHSMGTTIFFAGMSENPGYNAKIKAMFALAPVGTVSFINTWFAYLSYLQSQIEWLLELIGNYEIVPANSLVMKLVKSYCNLWWGNAYFCENLIFLIVGFDQKQFDASWMPVILDEMSSGTSLNTLLHYSQEYREGRFQHFDYGHRKNEIIYGQVVPPEYIMAKVTAPVHLIWGMNDYLADDRDVRFLIKRLANVKSKLVVPDKDFNHLDFLWAKNAKELVYEPIFRIMSNRKSYNSVY